MRCGLISRHSIGFVGLAPMEGDNSTPFSQHWGCANAAVRTCLRSTWKPWHHSEEMWRAEIWRVLLFFWLRFFSHDLDRTRRIIYIIYHNMYCMSAFCNCHCILIFTQSLGWILQLLINWWFAENWRPHNGFTRRMFNRGDSFRHYYKCPISSGNWLMIPNYANEPCLIFVHHGIHGHHYENVYLYTILYIIIYIYMYTHNT